MLSTFLNLSLAIPLAQEPSPQPPTVVQLVEQARALLPKYEGDTKTSLTETEERNTRAAIHLLDAALTLEPSSTLALWWRGHAFVLRAEDRRTRNDPEVARAHFRAALACYDDAIARKPGDAWVHYARGMARNNTGDLEGAIADYDIAIRYADETIAGGGAASAVQDARFIKFKARKWRADTRMRGLDFERARAEFRSFYADNGNNLWNLSYSLAEVALQERDFVRAKRIYESLIAEPRFESYDWSYAQLAYIEGLLGNARAARRRIDAAIDLEQTPTLYPMLWRWLLAEPATRAQSLEDLRQLLDDLPESVSAWDAELGKFVADPESDFAEFLSAAKRERQRRADAGEPVDNIMCEAWFYVGAWHDCHADAGADGPEKSAARMKAIRAYGLALNANPRNFKWEWAYARRWLSRNAAALQIDPGAKSSMVEDAAFVRGLSHGAGDATSVLSDDRERFPTALRPGHLERYLVRDGEGRLVVKQRLVGVR